MDTLSVRIYFSAIPANNPWQQLSWHLDGVLPTKTVNPEQAVQSIYTAETRLQIVRWEGLKVKLEQGSCQAYYENLAAPNSKIFVICHIDSSSQPRPFLVTLDLNEAEAYMETGEHIYSCSLTDELYFFLERFVVENYQPKSTIKRLKKIRSDNHGINK